VASYKRQGRGDPPGAGAGCDPPIRAPVSAVLQHGSATGDLSVLTRTGSTVSRNGAFTYDIIYVGFLLGHGGDALQMLDLANGIKTRGARVKIVLPALETSVKFKERCDILGIDCERSSKLSATMDVARQSPLSVLQLLTSIDAPLVHFHTGNSCLPRTVLAALEVLRYRPSFVTLQSPYETIVPGSLRARIWAATARRKLAAVVSPSEHGTDFQRRLGIPAATAVTVRNGIDIHKMASGDESRPRTALGIGADARIVLFCSRIDGQKRPIDAVRIFAGVAREFPTALLVFVGQGEEEHAVRQEAARLAINDRVRMIGYQMNVQDWLAASTVWLLPTERENFSVAVLEALAAGCAVLSTSCPGNDEVLVNEENSLTFSVGDVPSATEKLRQLLRDQSLRCGLGERAKSSAQEYSIENMVESYRRIYNRSTLAPDSLRT
jgi:glycosyltransferase involved in cell wall biosynthesis